MTILGYAISMPIFWLIVGVVFAIIEGLTMGLTTIWFTGGAIAALIASLLDLGVSAQVVLFFVVSVVLLVLTRKIFIKKLRTGQEKTNIDALIGMGAVVTTEIKPFQPGIVKINGQEWTAISEDSQETIGKNEKVEVIRIEGVKAVVAPFEEEQ
ncbi:membrane protein implicated in regulation of membrane protease activity [Clostridiales Family XIII bacterium PM5-7]